MYVELARYADAEPLLQRVVEIRQQGSEPRPLAQALARLGQLYGLEGRMTDSESLLRRAFDISLKAPGPDDPATFDMYAALAGALQDTGKYAEAEQLFEKAVALRERTAGGDDLVLADILVLLGTSYRLHGDYAHAEPPYLRAMGIREKNLAADAPLLGDRFFSRMPMARR